MNKYAQLKNKHQKTIDEFPIRFAFDQEQLEEGLEYLGVTEDEIIGIDGGGFIRKSDVKAWNEMWEQVETESTQAIQDDKDGTGFIADMFEYELANHEFDVTGDLEETLNSVGMTITTIANDPVLANGLKIGKQRYMDRQRENG